MSLHQQLALGTAQFGLAYGISGAGRAVEADEVKKILWLAADQGINRLDTAPGYGAIEERLAPLIKGLPFQVVSKIPAVPCGDLSWQTAWVARSIEQSAARLGDSLVGMLFHDASSLTVDGGSEIWTAAARCCERKGLQLGVSGYAPAEVVQLRSSFPLSMAQLPGNALDQRVSDFDNQLSGVEVTLRSIFLQGLLLMSPASASRGLPRSGDVVKRWDEWCAERGMTRVQGALSVARSLPAAYCVVGVETRAQLAEILDDWETSALAAPELRTDDPELIDPRQWP